MTEPRRRSDRGSEVPTERGGPVLETDMTGGEICRLVTSLTDHCAAEVRGKSYDQRRKIIADALWQVLEKSGTANLTKPKEPIRCQTE